MTHDEFRDKSGRQFRVYAAKWPPGLVTELVVCPDGRQMTRPSRARCAPAVLIGLTTMAIACSAGAHFPETVGKRPARGIAEPISSIEIEDNTHIAVTYRRPHCAEAAGYVITYERARITLTMYTTQAPIPGCIGGLGTGEATLTLRHAIDDRKFHDGACDPGRVLADSTDCETGFRLTR
jgi:hypothetical protein